MQAKLLLLAVVMQAPTMTAALFQPGTVMSEPAHEKVIGLITELKSRAEEDHRLAQESYEAYACWCEAKVTDTAAAVVTERQTIEDQQALIIKLKGEVGATDAEIKDLNKQIAANKASAKEATGVRNKEFQAYEGEKSGREESIGAMEAAIKLVTGAGTKKAFLDTTTRQAQLLDVVEKVRSVVDQDSLRAPSADVEMLKNFVAKPETFLGGASALQMGQNPMGDFAPASTQIQGIFKGMYDSFTAELEKSNVEEASAQKSFEALSTLKGSELGGLESALGLKSESHADKAQDLANAQTLLLDTKQQLAADETFFAKTKQACQAKSGEWSHQSRLRTEELTGLSKAIAILSSGSAEGTFSSAFNSLMQLNSATDSDHKALELLKALATKYKSPKWHKMAALLATKSAGHYNSIIAAVDTLVASIRSEEADDIKRRDSCQRQQTDNGNVLADLSASISSSNTKLGAMGTRLTNIRGEITGLENSISAANRTRTQLAGMRATAVEDNNKAVKDDTDAIGLLKQASAAMGTFFGAPKTTFSGKDYSGRKSETQGVVAILSMLVEDLNKEIKEAVADNAEAAKDYKTQVAALDKTIQAHQKTKVAKEMEAAQLAEKESNAEETKVGTMADDDAEKAQQRAIVLQCSLFLGATGDFETRKTTRAAELAGLADAKDFLAGGLR